MDKIVKFMQWDCKVLKRKYTNNDRVALELSDATDGETIAIATINVPEVALAPDEVIIKDYSENAGMLDCLLKAGIVEKSGRTVKHGYTESPICILCI